MKEMESLARETGFDQTSSNELAVACGEVFTNALKYANGCCCLVSRTTRGEGLKIQMEDSGPGITNIPQAMKDGFTSSKGSLGLGFKSIGQNTDRFVVENTDSGLRVILYKYIDRTPRYFRYSFSSNIDRTINPPEVDVAVYNRYGEELYLILTEYTAQTTKKEKDNSLFNQWLSDNRYKKLPDLWENIKHLENIPAFAVLILALNKYEYFIYGNLECIHSMNSKTPDDNIELPYRLGFGKITEGTAVFSLINSGIRPNFNLQHDQLHLIDLSLTAKNILEVYSLEKKDACVALASVHHV